MNVPLALLDYNTFGEIGMLLFLGIFLVAVIWVLFARPSHYRRSAELPLEDGRAVVSDPTAPRDSEGIDA